MCEPRVNIHDFQHQVYTSLFEGLSKGHLFSLNNPLEVELALSKYSEVP